MRAFVERVAEASVTVEGEVIARIGAGLLVYVGVEKADGESDAGYIAEKVRYLRFFEDEAGKMNLDVGQTGGEVLVVSAFTLQADARKGRRPAFDTAAEPGAANALYMKVVELLRGAGVKVQTGQFAAKMYVRAVNDGPICVPLDSKRLF
jgi:D-tyrosyl-tRNA(Tyr) deacylase